jgi:hypothetical protein
MVTLDTSILHRESRDLLQKAYKGVVARGFVFKHSRLHSDGLSQDRSEEEEDDGDDDDDDDDDEDEDCPGLVRALAWAQPRGLNVRDFSLIIPGSLRRYHYRELISAEKHSVVEQLISRCDRSYHCFRVHNVHNGTKYIETPLNYALSDGHGNIVAMLANKECNDDVTGSQKLKHFRCALFHFAKRGRVDALLLLLDKGASIVNVNTTFDKESDGASFAILLQDKAIAVLAAGSGFDENSDHFHDTMTLLDVAEFYEHREVAAMVRSKGGCRFEDIHTHS